MLGSKRKSALEEAAVDMAPLIDMTFLLLIFFLVNTNFIKETGIEVSRPEAASGEAKSGDMILIAVSAAGTYHMNGKRVDISAIRPAVAKVRIKSPDAPVIIVADATAKMGVTVAAMDECKLAGADKINIATKTGS